VSALLWVALGGVLAQGGETVELRGQVDSEQVGQVRVEILRSQGAGKNTLLIWSGWVQGPSDFAVDIPKDLGEVLLRAALDLKRDGIGPDDPQIRMPIRLDVGSEDIAGIKLRIRPPIHRSPALPEAPSPRLEPPEGPPPELLTPENR
jgi:hypothetical protein